MSSITVSNISKSYVPSKLILKDIFFEIKAGEKIGVLGPNGAGKTSLISILCGIIEANTGTIEYFENEQNIQYKQFKNILGYVPQELAFYQELSPIQNLNYFGAMYGLSKDLIAKRSKEILTILGLKNVQNNRSKTFSGGMKRRLNLAISILHEPKILFLDEPTVGIDVQSKNAIITFLKELNKKGTTIIYTSHLLKEAESLCDKVLLLDQGETIAYETIDELKKRTNLESLEEIFLALTGLEYRD